MSRGVYFKLRSVILLILIVVSSCCTVHNANAQGEDISDLVFSLDTVRSQEGKVDLLIALADATFDSDIEQSLNYSREALTIATSIEYLEGVAATHKFLGIGHAERGGFVEALSHFERALEGYLELGDSLGVADVYNNLGNQYSYGENDVEARRYYDQALLIYESLGVQNKISGINNNIGTLYLDSGAPDSALIFLNKAIASNLEVKNEDGLATNYTNVGYAHAELGDYEKAIESYNTCLEIGLRLGNKSIESVAYLNLGDSYMYLGNLDQAINSTIKGLKIAEEHGYVYNEYIGKYTLGEIYEKKGAFKDALKWFKEAEALNEELINSDNQAAMMNFQSEQLKKAQKAEIERINMLNEQNLKAEQFKNYLLLTAAASVLLILLGTSYYFLKRHRIMLKMSAQNLKIQEQSDQIMQQAQDISAVNDTLLDRNLRLRKLNEEKNYLMSVVAHDLKSPLNQINGLVNVIKLTDSNLTEEQRECLNNIYFASDRLSDMVSKVLNREVIDSDQIEITKSNIDVKELLSDIAQNFGGLAARKGIEIKKDLPEYKLELYSDKQYLQQIVDNLLSNAIKFSPKDSQVTVRGHIEEQQIIIEVIDQGPGLNDEDMQNLFKEHMILSAKPTGDEISTGLGLSIVKNYTEKLDGKVWAESVFGEGATFKVSFAIG